MIPIVVVELDCLLLDKDRRDYFRLLSAKLACSRAHCYLPLSYLKYDKYPDHC